MRNYDSEWTDLERALYDECYEAGDVWAEDPGTPDEDLQRVLSLADAADAEDPNAADSDFGPLVDAVSEAIGEGVTSVPVTRDDPGFRGFVDGVRDGAADDVFGL